MSFCTVCKGGEASLTTDCPGEFVGDELEQRVLAGEIDFENGAWHALKGKAVTRRRLILEN